ncbi:MAG: 50S ribosomal protein L9 [Ilumatobacteraceae bacterium]|nr:50S ribosomal protein L9 [Ilumatobacteraceae bacterium]
MSVKIILRSDLDGLGKRGDIVEVADGHARNYLLPKGHAIVASDGAIEQAARMRKARDERDATAREAATAIASALVPQVITISANAGSEGRLFGSVSAADIADAVREQTDIEIDRRDIDVDHIRTTGQHQVTASLHSDVSFPITLEVVAAE